MSSSGIVPINGGSVILRTYLDESADNSYLLGRYDFPLPSNTILVTSTNGLLISTTTINVSSVGTSSLFANTISTNQLFICTIYYSTFTSSQLNYQNTIVNNLSTSTITFVTMKGGTISSLQVNTNGVNANNGTFSTIIATSLVVSSINTNQLSTMGGTFSTLIGGNMTLNSLSTLLLSISSVFADLISTPMISSITLRASTIVLGNNRFSNATGNVLIASSLIASSIVTNHALFSTMVLSSLSTTSLFASTMYQLNGGFSTLIASTVITSTLFTPALNVFNTQTVCSITGSSIVIPSLAASTLYGGNTFFNTLSGGSITATNMTVSSMITSTIQFNTMTGLTATIALINASTLVLNTPYVASTLFTSSMIAQTSYASSVITSSISVNTYYINQPVYGQTIKKDSIGAFTNITLNSADCIARVDNAPSQPQLYSFGPTIPNLWIAGSNPNYATSSDGETWISRTINLFPQTNGFVWTGNIWVAAGAFGAQDSIATSTDGINWTGRGKTLLGQGFSPTVTIEFASSVSLALTFIFITGNGGAGIIGYSSDNGTTWFNISNSSGLNYANQIAWNGITAVVVGSGSSNNISWSDQFSVAWNTVPSSNVDFQIVNAIIWTGHQWVAGGQGANRIMYSLDAVTWISSPTGNAVFSSVPFPQNPSVNGLGWNGYMMIAAGYDTTNTLAYSMDEGKTWTGLGNTIFTNSASSVTWNGQMWVATGFGTNSTAYSYNGIHWYGGGTTILPLGICTAFNNRRPYYFYFSNNTLSAAGPIPGSNFPVVVPAGSQLDIVSDSYYNSGYTNFSATFQTHAS